MTLDDVTRSLLDPDELNTVLVEFCGLGPRFVGTRGERAARSFIERAFTEAGLSNVRAESVPVMAYRPGHASCRIPGETVGLPCSGLQFTAAGLVTAEAVLLGAPESPADLGYLDAGMPPVEGRIAVLRTPYPYVVVPDLVARGVAGVVILGATPDGLVGHFTAQLYPPSPAPDFPGVPHALVGVTVEAEAGRRLEARLEAGAAVTLELEHRARYEPVTTANVIGEIPGSGPERVVLGAHYDSQLDTVGACDNASGVSALIVFARRHALLTPRRTVVLAAFADEEHGCYGSLEYCRRHIDELDRTVAMVNLDALAWSADAQRALWADPSMREFCLDAANAVGWPVESELEASTFAGSDFNPFIDAGVPAAFFWRYPPPNPYYHSAGDRPESVDIDVACETANVAAHVVLELACASHVDLGRARPSHRWLDLVSRT